MARHRQETHTARNILVGASAGVIACFAFVVIVQRELGSPVELPTFDSLLPVDDSDFSSEGLGALLIHSGDTPELEATPDTSTRQGPTPPVASSPMISAEPSRAIPTPTPTVRFLAQTTKPALAPTVKPSVKPIAETKPATSAAKPTPKPVVKIPPKTQAATTTSLGARIVANARKYVGVGIPYVYGGDSFTAGMDCSHLVWHILQQSGINTGYRASGALASWTRRVSASEVQPGDLVLFKGHVGIYVSKGMMIDHGSGYGAKLRSIDLVDSFIGYGRIPT